MRNEADAATAIATANAVSSRSVAPAAWAAIGKTRTAAAVFETASVSRMVITSRTGEAEHAWQVKAANGEIEAAVPASGVTGTMLELHDLFYVQ